MKRAPAVFIGLVIFAVALLSGGDSSGTTCSDNSSLPPFIAAGTKPNILIILDNSNSMDEDFSGNAVGSYSTASKSVTAKQALQTIISELQNKANVGLMTFKLPSNVSSMYLYNAAYFASFQPSSYCPNPPDTCNQYCIDNTNTAAMNDCSAKCTAQNSSFSITPTDSIITSSADNSTLRQTYCPLIYPKTQKTSNPTDSSNNIYYKNAYPDYSNSDDGSSVFYYAGSDDPGTSYSPTNGSSGNWNTYKYYSSKSGTSDSFSGYSGYINKTGLSPTDTDMALGYYNFGQRLPAFYIGPTWESTSAPSAQSSTYMQGYLNVPIGDLSNSTQYNNVYNMLNPEKDTSSPVPWTTPYMACTSSNKNSCTYVVNAGNTPTAGALQSAFNYFNNTYPNGSSPINLTCQKNYVILVTDGLPDVKMDGTISSATSDPSVMNEVLTNIKNLKGYYNTSNVWQGVKKTFNNKTTINFPIPTYVLGMGLTPTAKSLLDQMAVAGGTATAQGHAYYADSSSDISTALEAIMDQLLGKVASGSSVSILSEKAQEGTNMMQAVFYPSKYFGTTNTTWPGYLYNYWFYISQALNNIREDTHHDYILNLLEDYGIEFNFNEQDGLTIQRYQDDTADGNPTKPIDTVTLDGLTPIWEAGKLLFETSSDSRTIYTVGADNATLEPFNTTNTTNTNLLSTTSSPLGSPANLDPCLKGASDTATLQNLISYVRGNEVGTCRSRTIGLCYNTNVSPAVSNNEGCNSNNDCASPYATCQKKVWKLGDIVYSTPKVQADYKYCSNGTDYNTTLCTQDTDCAGTSYPSCQKKESLVFVGANDGMLHAFKTGIETSDGVNAANHEVGKLTGIPTTDMGKELWAFVPKNSLPYLRCLAVPPPATCHVFMNDLSPYLTTMTVGGQTRTILIGGMRLGGGTWFNDIGSYCLDSHGQSSGNTCSTTSDCTSPYNSSCSSRQYCFDSNGNSNGALCSSKNDCVSPYNHQCTGAYHTTAPSDTCSATTASAVPCTYSSYPTADTCYNPSTCTGLSSYYALDVTDAENPKFLWEFSHPHLGYSFSGPAVIHRVDATGHDKYYVMLLSGPTIPGDGVNTGGQSTQDVYSFVLSLDPSTLGISSVLTNDLGNATKNGFGGRLFTNGLDVNNDGQTDFVFFGYSYSATGNPGDWKGGIAKVWTGDSDPSNWNWNVSNYFNIAQVPVTARIVTMQCFGQTYVYAASGRYFYHQDTYGPNGSSGNDFLMGVPFTCAADNTGCATNINSNHSNNNACTALQNLNGNSNNVGWQVPLDMATTDSTGSYLKERAITDPATTSDNMVYFTTSEPTSDPCGYAGRSRVWGLNCATSGAISDNTCTGYTIPNPTGNLYLQTSTGAVNKIDPANSFTQNGGKDTQWFQGMPPEEPPPTPPAPGAINGQMMLWIEK